MELRITSVATYALVMYITAIAQARSMSCTETQPDKLFGSLRSWTLYSIWTALDSLYCGTLQMSQETLKHLTLCCKPTWQVLTATKIVTGQCLVCTRSVQAYRKDFPFSSFHGVPVRYCNAQGRSVHLECSRATAGTDNLKCFKVLIRGRHLGCCQLVSSLSELICSLP